MCIVFYPKLRKCVHCAFCFTRILENLCKCIYFALIKVAITLHLGIQNKTPFDILTMDVGGSHKHIVNSPFHDERHVMLPLPV